MVSAIGIVPIALDLLWRDGNVLPALSAPRVDVAIDVLDFGRVAIRIIPTATVGIIRHVPCRIKLLVQSLILGGLLSRLLARWLRLGGAPWPLLLTSFVAIGGCHHRTNGHAEGRASQRRSGTRAQAANHSMLSHLVAIASDSAFSLPALLGRGSLARSHAPSNSKVFELCTRF